MSRSTKILAGAVAALVGLWLIYSAVWAYEAHWITGEVTVLGSPEPGRPTVKAGTIQVGGYPFWLKVDLSNAEIEGTTGRFAGARLTLAALNAEARPWTPKHWRVAAPEGALANLAHGDTATIGQLAGKIGIGAETTADIAGDDDVHVQLTAGNVQWHGNGLTLAGDRLTLAVSVPRQAPADHLGTAGSFSLDIAGLHLPAAVPPLGGVIDHIAVAGVVLGAIPALPLPQALDTWQKQGGTLEVRQLDLAWQSLAASGNGTLALDASLQPIGAFSMELAGYGAILNALVVGGQLKPDAARFIRLGLDLLAQPDASGHRVLKAPVTLQDGSVYIGPARLAKMPVIRW